MLKGLNEKEPESKFFYSAPLHSEKLIDDQMCAESDFFHSYSASVFQNLTPAPGITKIIVRILRCARKPCSHTVPHRKISEKMML